MDPKPQLQPLLNPHRPIVCAHCMHGHQVEVITGRANSPVEYHCGCGNYAVVGVPARWPFMVAVKEPVTYSTTYFSGVNPANNINANSSSPMQLGESLIEKRRKGEMLKPLKEEKSMGRHLICKVEGCEKYGAFFGFCATHFRVEYGITYYTYLKNRAHNGEDPKSVALRIKTDDHLNSVDAGRKNPPAAETKPPKPEKEKPVRETKEPAAETISPKEESKAAPDETQKAGKPIGLVGKDFITIVCKEDLIDRIREHANAEFRTPEQQVAWYLHHGMKACGA